MTRERDHPLHMQIRSRDHYDARRRQGCRGRGVDNVLSHVVAR